MCGLGFSATNFWFGFVFIVGRQKQIEGKWMSEWVYERNSSSECVCVHNYSTAHAIHECEDVI